MAIVETDHIMCSDICKEMRKKIIEMFTKIDELFTLLLTLITVVLITMLAIFFRLRWVWVIVFLLFLVFK